MKEFNAGDRVSVCRNVGNVGICWIDGFYIGVKEDKHIVRLNGDRVENVAVSDDAIRRL